MRIFTVFSAWIVVCSYGIALAGRTSVKATT